MSITENKMKHSLAVGRKMMEMSKVLGYPAPEEAFIIGLLHDIGYEFTDSKNHEKVGGQLLKSMGLFYWKPISEHGNPYCDDKHPLIWLLNYCDMTVNSAGEEVSTGERLCEIRKRYGADSVEAENSKKVVLRLKKEKPEYFEYDREKNKKPKKSLNIKVYF